VGDLRFNVQDCAFRAIAHRFLIFRTKSPLPSFLLPQTMHMFLYLFTIALLSYLVGCLNAGYYFVRLFYGQDIRLLGTGTAGARNAGRLYGPWGFSVVFLLDCVKGAALTALGLGMGVTYAGAAAVAVVVGHIWPVQLRFRGGKGVASALGALMVLAPILLLVIAFSVMVFKLMGQPLARAGIIGFWLATVAALLGHQPLPLIAATALLALLLTFSHRHHLWRKL
jgi:acyl phosphate:glycerol-3-phosphate acyltransferase